MDENVKHTPAMSRELMALIVDEVFDGAIEDTRVIEEIYAVIKRHEASPPAKLSAAAEAIEKAMEGVTPEASKNVFEFDRYINGRLMAEGVRIERAANLEAAMLTAARIASRGPHGEPPVLVLRADKVRAQAIEDVLSALTAHELYQYRPKAFHGFIEYARTLIQENKP